MKSVFAIYKQNVLISLGLSDSVHGRDISALEHNRMAIFSSYALLASIGLNTIYKYGHAWVI